jgi:hypothetical protein
MDPNYLFTQKENFLVVLDSRNANQDKKINIQPIDMEGVYIVKP